MEKSKQILVKGYMRPNKKAYTIVLPKEVRNEFKLEGGEYFVMLSQPETGSIVLKPVQFTNLDGAAN